MVNDLIFVKPEEEGLKSSAVLDFINFMEEIRFNFHSFMIVRNGKILTEAYYKPFNKDFAHRIYSCSKSYAALAVGKLYGEGKIKLTDPILKYFPEYDAVCTDKEKRETTIENLLTMTVPQPGTSYSVVTPEDWTTISTSWVESFFTRYSSIKPNGMHFNYDTSASYVLDALVEKLTGMTFLEYLRPEFKEIGVSEDIWCVKAPEGYSWGGSGVITTLRDFAKVGELTMHKGEYKGKQLLPRDYMEKATSKVVDTVIDNFFNYNCYGYGYQIWQSPHGFMFNGMGCQFVFCFPDKDFMFVCNSDMQCSGSSSSYQLYWEVAKLYKSLTDEKLPDSGFDKLQEKVNSLELVNGYGEKYSPFSQKLSGKKIDLNENKMGIKWFQIDFSGDTGVFKYENKRGVKEIPFGMEKHVEFVFPETDYPDEVIGTPCGRGYNCVASAAWTMEERLLIRVNAIDDYFGHIGITVEHKDGKIVLSMIKVAEFFFQDYKGLAIGELK